MKPRLLLSLLTLSGAAHAQNTSAPSVPVQSPSETQAPYFRDVPRDHWAFAAVQKLAAAGIIEGVGTNAAPDTFTVAPVLRAAGLKSVGMTPAVRAALGANPALKGVRVNALAQGQSSLVLQGTVKSAAQKQLANAIARKRAPGYKIIDLLRVAR